MALVPKVIYHPENTLEERYDSTITRFRREPASVALAVLLSFGVAATGLGTGTAALTQGNSRLAILQQAVDADIMEIEQNLQRLQESLTSLSEVVIQNRRGLDLLFLKEGGLCAALKEECCFYIDHSGVVKDSLAKLRERLEKRRREREQTQSWFEGWYNRSPWLSTLLSTIVGPLIILILILTFGPCIINRLL